MMTTTSLSTMMSRPDDLHARFSLEPRLWMARMARTRVAKGLAKMYGRVLETRVSPETALHIVHAQTAFCSVWLPVSLPTFLHVALAVWAVLASVGAWRSFRAGGGRLR